MKIILSASLLIFDQLTKLYFLSKDSAFTNPQGSFSLPINNQIAMLIGFIMITFLCYLLTLKNLSQLTRVALLLILSGGASNLLDRFTQGHTIDIIAFSATFFNLADIYIVLGIFIALISIYLPLKPKLHNERNHHL